jgi:hypothetical protein
MAKCTVKELIQMVLDEVDCFVKRHVFIPRQVMLPDNQYNVLRGERIMYQDFSINITNYGRVVNEECSKSSKNKTY